MYVISHLLLDQTSFQHSKFGADLLLADTGVGEDLWQHEDDDSGVVCLVLEQPDVLDVSVAVAARLSVATGTGQQDAALLVQARERQTCSIDGVQVYPPINGSLFVVHTDRITPQSPYWVIRG